MKKDHAGVYVPPPLIFAGIFFVAYLLQHYLPINHALLQNPIVYFAGILFFITALYLLMSGVSKFVKTGTTIVTMKPTSSLQETGIYKFTRNPMYFGMILLYLGFVCFYGNWWHLILFPILILIIQEYVIKREEKYLEREFGQAYKDYRKKVRRWV